MGKNSAEYMRAYRAKRKAAHFIYDADKPLIGQLKTELSEAQRFAIESAEEIGRLQEEVRDLKAELAKGSPLDPAAEYLYIKGGTVTPLTVTRTMQQAERDAILRKINRGG